MKWAAIMFALALAAGCTSTGKARVGGGPSATEERPCELVVKVRAEPKKGLRTLGKEGDYGEMSRERADAKIKRVDYSRLSDIVVIVEGPGYELATRQDWLDTPVIEITDAGFSRDMVAVMLARPAHGKPGGEGPAEATWPGTPVTFANKRAVAATLFAAAEADSFDITIAAGHSAEVYIRKPDVYTVYCEDDESWHCALVASESPFMREAKAGEDVKFFLPPGEFTVKVHAPRLPAWTGAVRVREDARGEAIATLGVNSLPKK